MINEIANDQAKKPIIAAVLFSKTKEENQILSAMHHGNVIYC